MEEAVLQLRGGDGLTDVVAVIAFVIFINWYDSLFGVEAFPVHPLPHQDPFGWLSGKYDSKNAGNGQCLSHPPSRFERETLQTMKQMCAASADENGFVMSYDEAYNLVKETYSGSMQVTEDFKITDWQAASHLYHGKGVNVNPENNSLLDFGIATEVKYAEIFACKSFGTSKRRDICFLPDSPSEETVSLVKPNLESTALDVVELSRDQAINLLKRKYGSHFITVANGEFKIEEWQAVKKLEHGVCFGIKSLDYGFSQDQAKEINDPGGLVSYVQKGKTLPSMDLVRTFQNALKNFCEDRNQSNRNDESTFRGEPAITFFNKEARQIVVFKRETKIFITAYKLAERSVDKYLATGHIGK